MSRGRWGARQGRSAAERRKHSQQVTILPTATNVVQHNASQSHVPGEGGRVGTGRRGEAYSFVACLGHLTIDHASLSRWSTVPNPNRETSNIMGAHYASSTHYTEAVCLSYPRPVSPSAATIYLLGKRSFSRYSLFYQTLPCHISLILLVSSSNASRSSL